MYPPFPIPERFVINYGCIVHYNANLSFFFTLCLNWAQKYHHIEAVLHLEFVYSFGVVIHTADPCIRTFLADGIAPWCGVCFHDYSGRLNEYSKT